jgi:predicted transposase YdaD
LYGRRASAVRTARADKILDVRFESRPPVLLHVEFQTEGRATIPRRMADYLSMILGLLGSPEHAGKTPAAVVVYLDRATYREDPGFLEIRGELGLFLHFAYRVIKLWDLDPDAILGMESPGLCPYVPLMRGNPVELLVKSKERILEAPEDRVSLETKKELLAVLAGLATRVVVEREVLDRVVTEIEAMGENYVFDRFFNRGREAGLREGVAKGREEGREKGREEGRVEGREEGALAEARENILRILRRRFGAAAVDLSHRLSRISSRSDLESLLEDAAVAGTLDEFLRRLPSSSAAPPR